MKDLDHKETTATLEQMKQKDRLVKLELTNKLLAGRKEVMDTCLEQYEEVENTFATMLGQKVKQIMENMPKTKSSRSIDKQEAEEVEAWRMMIYQEIEDYHKDTKPELQAGIKDNVIQALQDIKVYKRKLEETPDSKEKNRSTNKLWKKFIKENKERIDSPDNDTLMEIEENKTVDMMHRTSANELMNFREKSIKESLMDPDTLLIVIHRHK